jgi:hypothetical protein
MSATDDPLVVSLTPLLHETLKETAGKTSFLGQDTRNNWRELFMIPYEC